MGLKLYKKKSFKILLISGILIILGFFIIFNHSQILKWWENNFMGVEAGTSDNVRGWAWGENMGWISMNCYNDFDYDYVFENCCSGGLDCPEELNGSGGSWQNNYGVTYVDTSLGNYIGDALMGYAWSDKVGWICFGKSCKCADCTSCQNYNTCTDCSGCPDNVKPPHGWPFPWACVGKPTWICSNDDNQTCINDDGCPGGTCVFSCSGDGVENFLDISTLKAPCYSANGDKLKAHWKMNGDIAEALTDSSNYGYGNTLSGNDLPILANGKFEDALQFDGEDDYIQADDSESLSISGNLTVEAWVKRGTIGSEQTIIGKWDEAVEGKSYRLWFDLNNRLNFSVANASEVEATITQALGICFGGSNENTLCSADATCEGLGAFCRNAPITDTTKWHHVVGKYIAKVGTNDASLQLFVDGARVDVEFPLQTPPDSLSDKDNELYVGAKMGDLEMDTYFNGVIDNVAIWSCANVGFLSGRSAKDIWADAKMEVSGWAKVVALGDGGWLKLQGATKAGKVWGLYLDDYDTFYTIGGYMANRYADTSMDTTGLVANWLMDEPSWVNSAGPITNGVVDSSPLPKYPGTAYGAVPNTDGIFNSAGEFDGFDDYIDCGSGDSLEVPTTTIQAWIKRNSIDTRDVIMSDNITSASGKDHFLRFEINSADQLTIIFGDGTTDVNRYSVGTINDTNWHHIAVVRDDTDKTITFYIDGGAEDEQSYTGLGTIITLGVNNLWIGRSNVTDSNVFFHGLIDNVSIYNVARIAAQVLADYNKKDPYCVGWDDYDHEYGDPPAPFDFEITEINNTEGCEQLFVYWDPSVWAESYTYERCDGEEEAGCLTCDYTERNVLSGACTDEECSLQDAGLIANTGYCYKIQAHNETGSTYNSNDPIPVWKRTTLCSPETPTIDDDTCGEIQLTWGWEPDGSADGYNVYNSLSSSENFGMISHLGEGMDYTGLMAQWKMNESSWDGINKEVRDSSNQTPANHGTAENLLSTTPSGKFSYAGDFDGSGDYITVPSKTGIEITGAITVEAWIKPTNGTMSYDARVVSKGHTSFEDPYAMYELNLTSGKPRFRISVSDSPYEADSGDSITFDQWHHLAGTYDGVNIKIYVDGILKNTTVIVGSIDTNNQELVIGRHLQSAGMFFNGLIDNVAIYNVARTAEQIKFDYEAGNCGYDNCSLSGECHIQGLDTNCGYALEDESNCTNCPNYVCHIQGNPDGNCGITIAGDASICCYTDKRILPYVNYYYKTTATSEAGESPFSDCDWTGDDCPAISGDPCCPNGNTICFPPVETEEE